MNHVFLYVPLFAVGASAFLLLRMFCLRMAKKEESFRRTAVSGRAGAFASGISGGVVACLAYFLYPPANAAICFLFVGTLFFAGCFDHMTFELPDAATAFAALLAVPSYFCDGVSLTERLIGAVAVSLPLLVLMLAVKRSCGFGDVKLYAACGAFLGWKRLLCSFYVTVIVGAVAVFVLRVAKKLKMRDAVAFGPYIALGCSVAALCGDGAVKILSCILFGDPLFLLS